MENVRADYKRWRESRPTMARILSLAIMNAGFRAAFLYRLAHASRSRGFRLVAGALDRLNFASTHCSISSSSKIGPGFKIAHVGGIVIGGKTVIGSMCHIRHSTTFGGNWSKARADDPAWTQPKVGDNVVIGCGAVILGPILVGSNSRIGANSVVTRDVEEDATYAGNPARRIR